ncbi:hypothetical protein E2C01_049757 [Portunus trituberculatus]|uniref:Uncharacterized protein n=1 Tax=Portunus trituberculatus TaxID=210409 RepID=A0A5B7GAB0_PORTR|nr:hypothetical protein [Portunus trituberculatus]
MYIYIVYICHFSSVLLPFLYVISHYIHLFIYVFDFTCFSQTMILEGALDLHGRIAPSANQPLHKRLVEVFEGLRSKVRKMCSTPQSQRSTSSLQSTPPPPPTHRRADSDPATEFRRTGSIINSPLPPLPSDKGAISLSSSSTSGHSSQRSSQSSSLYAHFQSGSHDDDIYAKPQEWDGNLGVQRDSRPRSAFISDSRGSSPKSLSKSLNNDYMIVPPPKLSLPQSEKVCMKHFNSSQAEVDEYHGPYFSDEAHRWRYSRPPSPRTARSSITQDSANSLWCDSQGSDESLPPLPPRGMLTVRFADQCSMFCEVQCEFFGYKFSIATIFSFFSTMNLIVFHYHPEKIYIIHIVVISWYSFIIYLYLLLDRWTIIYLHELVIDNCTVPDFISLIHVTKNVI